MWKHRFLIKGSQQETEWLNRLAKKHYLLTGIRGNWYQFKRVEASYRVFSEYVSQDVVTAMTEENTAFKVLVTVQLQDPDVQVVYTGSDQPELQTTMMAPSDPQMRLKVALHLRDQAMNTINLSLFAGVVVWGSMIIFAIQQGSDTFISWAVLLSLVGLFALLRLYRAAHNLQKQIVQLRRDTDEYDGAWMPTMHVFINQLTADLDIESADLKSLGRWTLVWHSKKGQYWYDLQTLANEQEIKQSLQVDIPTTATVNVFSWLGLAPVMWFV